MIGRSVLDSAGGICRLEFQTMLETMGSTSYALFLDDRCNADGRGRTSTSKKRLFLAIGRGGL